MTPAFQGPAPFHGAVAQAPAEAYAVWARSGDGLRLRIGNFARGDRGTILLLQGRTEYLEKYGQTATEFARRGYGMASVDFRGQGLSDRLIPDRLIGHVGAFSDYQHDVAALMAFAKTEDLPRPWFLLSHSLGGAVALRALIGGLDVRATIFNAPLWGLNMPKLLVPVSYGLGWLGHRLSLNNWVTPGTSHKVYVREADPQDNVLTHDARMLAYLRAHLDAEPGMGLGGPNVPWLYRALMECRDLRRVDLPQIPSLTFLPADEVIVSKGAIRNLTARWTDAILIEVPGGAHETMMETPERRALFFGAATGFLDAHRR